MSEAPIVVGVDWNSVTLTSKTEPTFLIITHPLLRKDPVRASAFQLVCELDAKYVRYMPYSTHPRLSFPELEPPTTERTFWDFSLIDAELIPFLEATKGKEPVICFDAIPAWMLKTSKRIAYPEDPDQGTMEYMMQGQVQAAGVVDYGQVSASELLDPTGRQLAEYHARIVSWYSQGGFTDENGNYHRSGHHYELPWWGILNEPDLIYAMTPQQYTRLYDAIVTAVRQINPATRFVGPGLALPGPPAFFEYFLDPKNHQPGIAVDMLAYHFYSATAYHQPVASAAYTFFDRADGFFETLKYLEHLRQQLSPDTLVNLDEWGVVLPGHWEPWFAPGPGTIPAIPEDFWNLAGAFFAYGYLGLAREGIDVVTAGWFVGYNKSVSMVDWETGEPNAWFRTIELIKNHFGPGDALVTTTVPLVTLSYPDVAAQGFVTSRGKKLLLINKRDRDIQLDISSAGAIKEMRVVDVQSGGGAPRAEMQKSNNLYLSPFAVAVVDVQ